MAKTNYWYDHIAQAREHASQLRKRGFNAYIKRAKHVGYYVYYYPKVK